MKSIIIYYSYSGNTRKVAEVLAEHLRQKGEAEILELKAEDESNSFFRQCKRAFWHKKAEIAAVNFDLSGYDLICVGTPVWAFGPAPAVNAYLDQCLGVNGKDAILFTTYGSGAGKERCINYMQNILAKKGAKDFKRFSIQQFKVNDKEFILSEIKSLRLRFDFAHHTADISKIMRL
jgi:flavodoxin